MKLARFTFTCFIVRQTGSPSGGVTGEQLGYCAREDSQRLFFRVDTFFRNC